MRPVKFEMLAGKLEEMISCREVNCGEQIPSQNQLVMQFKVSRSCVNKALNLLHQKGLISKVPGKGNFVSSPEKTQPKILKRLAYLIDNNMRRYRRGGDDYGLETLCGIEEECKKYKISFILRTISPDEYPDLPVIVKGLDVDGVIINYSIPDVHVRAVASLKIPTVYADIPCHAAGVGCCMVNYHDAYITITGKLRDGGLKKISFFYPQTGKYGMEIKGAADSIRNMYPELDVRSVDFSIPGIPYDANRDMELIYSTLEKIIKENSLPDIFICNTDYIAEKLMKALNENGIKVPSDVQIIGGLGLPFAENTNPPISTLYVDPELLGRKTVEMLYEMLASGINEKNERIPMRYKMGGTCSVLL